MGTESIRWFVGSCRMTDRSAATGLNGQVIVWINGAFGVGKTSVARELVEMLPDARLVDPERIGFVVQRTFWRGRDYQQVELWRSLVARRVRWVGRRRTAVVPMTVTDLAILGQVAGDATVFVLVAPREELMARIELSREAVEWRVAQLDRCLSAFDGSVLGTPVQTEGRTPAEIAREIALLVNESSRQH